MGNKWSLWGSVGCCIISCFYHHSHHSYGSQPITVQVGSRPRPLQRREVLCPSLTSHKSAYQMEPPPMSNDLFQLYNQQVFSGCLVRFFWWFPQSNCLSTNLWDIQRRTIFQDSVQFIPLKVAHWVPKKNPTFFRLLLNRWALGAQESLSNCAVWEQVC